MSLALDIVYGHGLNNDESCQSQPKKTNGNAELAVHNSKGHFSCCTLLIRQSTSALKVGVPHGWRSI